MQQHPMEPHIRSCFQAIYPGKVVDFIYPNEDQIYVYVDGMMFIADLFSDDDGFFYFVPMIDGHRMTDLSVRVRYPV